MQALSALFSAENIASSQLAREHAEKARKAAAESEDRAATSCIRVKYRAKSKKSVAGADSVMNTYGVVILEPSAKADNSDESNSRKQQKSVKESDSAESRLLLPIELLQAMREESGKIEKVICSRLGELNIETAVSRRLKRMVLNETAQTSNFKFQEVSSRCLGRLDVRYGMDSYPFSDPRILENSPWLPLVHKMLGNDAVLKYMGLIYSYPGSVDQPFHGDGPHLFGNNFQAPMHAVNVFIPLSDISKDLGPTEFVLGSHILENAKTVQTTLQKNGTVPKNTGEVFLEEIDYAEDVDPNMNKLISPLLKFGSVLLYDYRTIHRGVTNSSLSECRHMFYMLYSKPWFNESVNFGEVSLFSDDAKDLAQELVTKEVPSCSGEKRSPETRQGKSELSSKKSKKLRLAQFEDENSAGYCDLNNM